ncbi:hypothetical protein HYX15_02695 [Candidatus Woesearchaeota archaeon]|nr:hypothetical protein [Candidatus Woesearchaeota archaeon]
MKKFDDKFDYRKGLLGALLVSSTTENDFLLPTIEEFVLSEIINGTIDYINGNAGKLSYHDFRFNRNHFEREIWKYFESELKSSKRELNSKIMDSITTMCKYYMVTPDGPDRPYPETELYILFKGPFGSGGICPVLMRSAFSLPQELVLKVQRELIPLLSEAEKRDIKGIGKSMRKYISKDLGFIRETYHW